MIDEPHAKAGEPANSPLSPPDVSCVCRRVPTLYQLSRGIGSVPAPGRILRTKRDTDTTSLSKGETSGCLGAAHGLSHFRCRSVTFARRCSTPSSFSCLQAGVAALTQQTDCGMVPSDSARWRSDARSVLIAQLHGSRRRGM